jgi:glycosyltransferase involved in cell wall biosynthesis
VMLLDNHHGPDPRVAFETELLAQVGIATRVVAWDRRSKAEKGDREASPAEVVRIGVPAPSGGGWRSVLAVVRFGFRVWRRRRRLFRSSSLLVVHDVYLLPLGWMLSRRLRLPFLYDAHEEYARMEAGRYPRWLLRLVTLLESRLARSAVAVVVPGASRTSRWAGVLDRPPIVLQNLLQRGQFVQDGGPIEWDLLYVGTLSEVRRPDILIELARLRPDLRIGIAGRGRSVPDVTHAAGELPNVSYLGWRADVDALFAAAKAIYYGLDPRHPYSDVACPNTLYHALRHRKPLLYFCGGEMADLATEFNIGIRCEPSAKAISVAVDQIATISDWEFDDAWRAVQERAGTEEFVRAVATATNRSI